jgi:hypothetical protein
VQLQRTIGNRAVGRILVAARDGSAAAGDHQARAPLRPETASMAAAEPDQVTVMPAFRAAAVGEALSDQVDHDIPRNRTGLPDDLKAGIETLSGLTADDVRVHYNSARPADFQASAYARGTEIHIGPGQERHLPHEAWHVVQQKQGRVAPTVRAAGQSFNDDAALETEADVMGARAAATKVAGGAGGEDQTPDDPPVRQAKRAMRPGRPGSASAPTSGVLQMQEDEVLLGRSVAALIAIVGLQGWNWLRANWPAGRSVIDLISILRQAGFANGMIFARLARWTSANVIALARAFAANAGGRSAADWAAIAAAHANLVDREAAVAVFARTAAWTPANLAALAGLFGAKAGGRSAAQWAAIAASLVDRQADVAALARVAAWTPANLATLAGLFAANGGGRSAAQWAAIAAHLVDREADVAVFARIAAWNPGNLATLARLFAADAGGRGPAQWAAIAANLVDREADVALFARIAGWTPANLATLSGLFATDAGGQTRGQWAVIATAHANLVDHEADVAALARITNWPALGLAALAAVGWTSAQLVSFVAQARAAGAGAGALRSLVGQAGFAAATVALLAAGWSRRALARFVGGTLQGGVAPADLQQLIATAGFAASSHGMIQAGWTARSFGTFAAHVHAGGVAAGPFQVLLNTGGFAASSVVMEAAGWQPAQLGNFVAAALVGVMSAADLQGQLAVAGFDATSFAWFGNGWGAPRLGSFVAAARAPILNLAAANLQAFMATAGSDAAAAALIATWGAAAIGRTVGHALTRAGAPTDAELVEILELAPGPGWLAASVRGATTAATCGAPTWANVIAHAPTFVANWVAAAGAGGMGGALVVQNTFASGHGYQVRLSLYRGRVQHVQNGHSFDHFDMTYANAVRNGVGGNITFYAAATDVPAHVAGKVALAHALAIAAAQANAFQQANVAGDRLGIDMHAGVAPANTRWTALTECFPLAGTDIVGRDLVAIGRLMGQIP